MYLKSQAQVSLQKWHVLGVNMKQQNLVFLSPWLFLFCLDCVGEIEIFLYACRFF